MEVRKPGRPVNPNPNIWRKTLVQDDPAQMELLEATGHTHSEAYRAGSRMFTKTGIQAGQDLEQIKTKIEELNLIIQQAQAQQQALLYEKQEREEEATRAQKAQEFLDTAIPAATKTLYENRDIIKNGKQFKLWRIEAALNYLPDKRITVKDIDKFFKESEKFPSKEMITDFIKSYYF
jgi:hypothetical protein